MLCTIFVRGARKPGSWSEVDTATDLDTAANIVRAWYAKGYKVRLHVERA